MKSFSPALWEHFKSQLPDIEKDVSDQKGSYQGLLAEALYSDPEDLSRIFQSPLVHGNLIDLGAGVGLSCIIYGMLFPERKALGIEFEPSRLDFARRMAEELQLPNVSFELADLLRISIPKGHTYFLYFPTGMVLDKILQDLYLSQETFILIAIESHGDLLPRLERENWLELVEEIPLKSERHYPKAKVYQRLLSARDDQLILHQHSFKRNYLLVDEGEQWIGETYDLEWSKDDQYDLKIPPRTISFNNVRKILSEDEIAPEVMQAIELRRLGEIVIRTKGTTLQGYIRKIIVSPSFRLEISTGEKVEWSQILTISQGSRICYES